MASEISLTMATDPQPNPPDTTVRVRHGRVASVDVFEIKESELEIFEKGSPADLQLNFALPLLTMAFEAVCILVTATFANQTTKTVFIVLAVVGALFGLYLLVAWKRNRKSLKIVCRTIRSRIPSEPAETEATSAALPAAPSGKRSWLPKWLRSRK